jgi:UDP-glucose 4-epimerase
VGADVPYTVNQLAQTVTTAMSMPDHPIRYLDARNEVKDAFSDHTKIRQVFGEQQATSLQDGLARMLEWAERRGPQIPSRFSNIEIERNLPSIWSENAAASTRADGR